MQRGLDSFARGALITLLVVALASALAQGQSVCNANGNIVLFSNYEGGTLNIDVDQNIPNLYIGVSSYEYSHINITGPFAGNVQGVVWAGFGDQCWCEGHTDVQVAGVAAALVDVYAQTQGNPAVSPYLGGEVLPGLLVNCITGAEGECGAPSSGGLSSNNLIAQFFLSLWGGSIYSHFTQYECWSANQYNVSSGGNCCEIAPDAPVNPLYDANGTYSLGLQESYSLCDGTVQLSLPWEVPVGNDPWTGWIWSNGATGSQVTITQPGTYTVTGADVCHSGQWGSLLTASFEVTPCEADVTVDLGPDLLLCSGASQEIIANVTGGFPPYTYQWTPALGNAPGPFSINASAAVYTCTVTDAFGNTGSDQLQVGVDNAVVTVELGADRTFCPGDAPLDASHPEAIAYLWSTGAATPSITPRNSGVYTVTVTGTCNEVSDEVTVDVVPPLRPSYQAEVSFCEGTTATIGPALDEGQQLLWNTGALVSPITVDAGGTYTFEMNNRCGTSRFDILVEALDCSCEIYIPNAFTPNADGVNDLFRAVTSCEFDKWDLRIFNRWGTELWQGDSPEAHWNGSSPGTDYYAGTDVYVYYLEALPKPTLGIPLPIKRRGFISIVK